MKISSMMAALESAKEQYGDIEVGVNHGDERGLPLQLTVRAYLGDPTTGMLKVPEPEVCILSVPLDRPKRSCRCCGGKR